MNFPDEASIFLSTLGMSWGGGKAYARVKLQSLVNASTASASSSLFQAKNRFTCVDSFVANKSISGTPQMLISLAKSARGRCQSGIDWRREAASACRFSSEDMYTGRISIWRR